MGGLFLNDWLSEGFRDVHVWLCVLHYQVKSDLDLFNAGIVQICWNEQKAGDVC